MCLKGEDMSGDSGFDSLFEELKESFIETAVEKIDALDEMIVALRDDPKGNDQVLGEFRRQVHSLKGLGGTFGFPLVSVICHRMEGYIEIAREYSVADFDDVQVFVDQIRRVVENRDNPDEAESEEILHVLPAQAGATQAPRALHETKIVLATPMAAMRQLAEFFLTEQGCQVISTGSSVEAFQLIVENRPDLVVSSVQMETLSGIDLGRAISAISFLRNTRVSLLTSSADAGDLDARIPGEFSFIRTDSLEDDISEVLGDIVQ